MSWPTLIAAYWLIGVCRLLTRVKPQLVHWLDWCLAMMVAAWFWPWFRRSK